LGEKLEAQRDVFYRGAPIFSKDDQVLDIQLFKLLEAFKGVLETADTQVRDIIVEEIPVEVRIREILDILEAKPFVRFSDLFPEGAPRRTLIVTFLAMLELIRLKQVQVTQTDNFEEIHINKAANEMELTSLPN
jgi:segregation and condensation protein A